MSNKVTSPIRSSVSRGFGSSTVRNVVVSANITNLAVQKLKKGENARKLLLSHLDESPSSINDAPTTEHIIIDIQGDDNDSPTPIRSLEVNNFESRKVAEQVRVVESRLDSQYLDHLECRVTEQEKAKDNIKRILLEIIERFESFCSGNAGLTGNVVAIQRKVEDQASDMASLHAEVSSILKDHAKTVRDLKLRDEENFRRVQAMESEINAMRTQLQRSDFLISSLLVEVRELRDNEAKNGEIVESLSKQAADRSPYPMMSQSQILEIANNSANLNLTEPEISQPAPINDAQNNNNGPGIHISDNLSYLISIGFIVKKHSKFGSPKTRLLRVSDDLSIVKWADSKTIMSGFTLSDAFSSATWSTSDLYTLNGDSIVVCLSEVVRGKKTKRMAKTKVADELCLSLVFSSSGRETLDIECSSLKDRDTMADAFDELLVHITFMKDQGI